MLLETVRVRLVDSSNWIDISAGENHSVGIKSDGTLWATGKNNEGQLGLNASYDVVLFVQIGTDTDWLDVDAGYNHNIAKKQYSVWAWGRNTFGNLGDTSNTIRYAPVKVSDDEYWVILATKENTYIQARYGYKDLFTTGNNSSGQIGNGTTTTSNIFKRVSG